MCHPKVFYCILLQVIVCITSHYANTASIHSNEVYKSEYKSLNYL